ncbi:type I-E CRISPR-associated protein Cas6/Cse3/CasE, partial [Escherichia sp. TWPC-MK]
GGKERQFLYRREELQGAFRFFVLSQERPAESETFTIECRSFAPELRTGQSLCFNLRANPTICKAGKRHDLLLASLANTAMPQLFALAREYADNSAREVVMFSSVMRAQLSLAWVIGPPLAFMLALNYGFTVMFSIAAGIFTLSLVLIAFMLPSVARVELPSENALSMQGGWQVHINVEATNNIRTLLSCQ